MICANLRAIAFLLPQYHPIAENDQWWGKGFTEWTNVVRARPLFEGHYQPHLPADLGFYDLRLLEVREAQAALARQYGIHGFCYYHYWFNGRRILERPFNEVLESGEPDLPFCLCWANENWTRVWDGGAENVLLEQKYDHDDDVAHIVSLIPAFKDPRYIRVDGRPLFLVYRTELLPDPGKTAALWQEEAKCAGLPGLYLALVQHFSKEVDPREIGFDAAVEFAPDASKGGKIMFRGRFLSFLTRLGLFPTIFRDGRVCSYPATVAGMLSKPAPPYRWFRCVYPMWDNTARRQGNAALYLDSTPTIYGRWLRRIIQWTRANHSGDEQLVFINAWNEWAEGCHLEPDLKWGHAYLEATRAALSDSEPEASPKQQVAEGAIGRAKQVYWHVRQLAITFRTALKIVLWQLRQTPPPE